MERTRCKDTVSLKVLSCKIHSVLFSDQCSMSCCIKVLGCLGFDRDVVVNQGRGVQLLVVNVMSLLRVYSMVILYTIKSACGETFVDRQALSSFHTTFQIFTVKRHPVLKKVAISYPVRKSRMVLIL